VYTLYRASGQIEFEDIVVYILHGLEIAVRLPLLLYDLPLGHIHAGALEFLLTLLIHAFCDPAEKMRPAAVTAQNGHVTGDGAAPAIAPLQIKGKASAILIGDHHVDVLPVFPERQKSRSSYRERRGI
jgi:hypothetical protein